jgi:hypothetical protein
LDKLISVRFNVDDEQEGNLHKAIIDSKANFAGTTKELWAKHLNMPYTKKTVGRPKKESK